jgi:hypothetical protein
MHTDLIITIVLIFTLILIVYASKKKETRTVLETYKNYKLQTGDLVLFETNFFLTSFNKIFTKSKYTHVGLVIDGEKQLIIHVNSLKNNMASYLLKLYNINKTIDTNKDGDGNGVVIHTLEYLLKNASNNKIDILSIKNPLSSREVFLQCVKYLDKTLSDEKSLVIDFINAGNRFLPDLYRIDKNNNFICPPLIVLLLKDLGFNLPKKHISKFIPDDFINVEGYDKSKIYSLNMFYPIEYIKLKIRTLLYSILPLPKVTPFFN